MSLEVMLVGDLAVVGLPNGDGDPTDVPCELDQLLTENRPYEIHLRNPGETFWRNSRNVSDDYLQSIVWACMLIEISEAGTEELLKPA